MNNNEDHEGYDDYECVTDMEGNEILNETGTMKLAMDKKQGINVD